MLPAREPFRIVIYIVGTVLLFAGGVALSRSIDVQVSLSSRITQDDSMSGYRPQFRPTDGRQFELVYIGASACGWSNVDGLPDAVNRIKLRLAEYAETHRIGFKATGVAVDWQPEKGVEHLKKFGAFDEISSGYDWGNTLALRDIWDPTEIHPQTPQLILYQRDFSIAKGRAGPPRYFETNRIRLITKIGSSAILEWAAVGVQVPGFVESIM